MDSTHKVIEKYKDHFGAPKLTIFSPGRANIIGEHIDYHGGLVLPFALNLGISLCFGRRSDNQLAIYALDKQESYIGDLRDFKNTREAGWRAFLRNALELLDIDGGFNCYFGGDLPIGAGLSSSSALTLGFIFGCSRMTNKDISKLEMIKLASRAENNTGVLGGMMDQYAIMFGKEKHAIALDCKDHSFNYIPVNFNDYEFVLFNSGDGHNLVETEYNDRREVSEKGLAVILEASGLDHFSDLRPGQVKQTTDKLSPREFALCIYAVEENLRAKEVLEKLPNEPQNLGNLMLKSHRGLSKLYKVSTPALDYLVELAKQNEEILGARMMGGGFGGCTINLVKKGTDLSQIEARFSDRFKGLAKYNISPSGGLRSC